MTNNTHWSFGVVTKAVGAFWGLCLQSVSKFAKSNFFEIAAFFVIFFCWCVYAFLFGLYFQTNDDVAMSMMADGYGIAAKPYFLNGFQGFFKGWLVSFSPRILGMDRYAVFTFFCLFAALAATIQFIASHVKDRRQNIFFIPFILFFWPLTSPQFTVVASIMATVGFVYLVEGLQKSALQKYVYISTGLFFYSVGIATRLEAALLATTLLCIALFMCNAVAWRTLALSVAFSAVCLSLQLSIDSFAYGAEWDYFLKFNTAKFQLIDLGGIRTAIDLFEEINTYGLSKNDLQLVGRWWFLDTSIASPEIFENIWREISSEHSVVSIKSSVANVVEALIRVEILYGIIVILLVVLLSRSRTIQYGIMITICALVGCLILLEFSGRGIPPRVVQALIFPVLLFSISWGMVKAKKFQRRYFQATAIPTALILLFYNNLYISSGKLTESRAWKSYFAKSTKDLSETGPQVVLGAALNYELAYPILGQNKKIRKVTIFPLGWPTVSPPVQNIYPGGSAFVLNSFISSQGIQLFYSENDERYLRRYCAEKFGRRLYVTKLVNFRTYRHATLKCT